MSRSRNLRLARYIYTKSQNNRSPAFCPCSPMNPDLCVCGENDSRTLHWQWNIEYFADASNLLIDGRNVMFHPIFSQGMYGGGMVMRERRTKFDFEFLFHFRGNETGTAAVKGNKRLDKQMIHYWEIKIMSSMTGTDLVSISFFAFRKLKFSDFFFQNEWLCR